MRRWAGLLFGLSLLIRLAALARESIWYDESFTFLLASLPLPRMLAATTGDVHSPLWYAVEWGVIRLMGGSPLALRLPSALFGAAAVAELYLLLRRFTDQRGALAGAALMMISPAHLYYSQEARMYSFLTLMVLLATRAALEQNYWRLAPSLALVLYGHNLGALYAGIIGVIALWQGRKRAIPALAASGLAWLPWLASMVKQIQTINGGFWIPPTGIGGALYVFNFGTFYDRVPEFAQWHGIVLALFASGAAVWILRKEARRYAPLLALAFGPTVLMYFASVLWRPLVLHRAMIPSAAILLGLWGAALFKLPRRERVYAYALIVPMLAISIMGYYTNTARQRLPVDSYAQYIADRWEPGDSIYNINLATDITFRYYLDPAEYPTYRFPMTGSLSQSLSDETRLAMGIKSEELSITALPQLGYQRTWLLFADTPVISDPEIQAARDIMRDYEVIESTVLYEDRLGRFTVVLVGLQ